MWIRKDAMDDSITAPQKTEIIATIRFSYATSKCIPKENEDSTQYRC